MRRRELWEAQEVGAFLATSADTRLEAAWHLLAVAGLRVGEVLGLRWADFDAVTGRINVRNAVVDVPYAALTAPAAGPSARSLTVSADVRGALSRHRSRQDAGQSERGRHYQDAGLVICRENGRPLHPRALQRAFRQRVAAAGLPAIALADLRRSRDWAARRKGVQP